MTDTQPLTDAELTRLRDKFPAKYSAPILEAVATEIRVRLLSDPVVLDPFAGPGGIHKLAELVPCRTIGIELEPELAACHEGTICGDSRHAAQLLDRWPLGPVHPDVIAFSPAYGNRFADQYLGSDDEKCRACSGSGHLVRMDPIPGKVKCEACGGSGRARSQRQGYAVHLGRRLTPGSGASLAWGQRYRETHALILEHLATEVARPGTLWLVNVSSIFKDKRYIGVMEWWVREMARQRLALVDLLPIPTARMGHGQNAELRAPVEHLIVAVSP